jgi:molybdate transport system permease protein
MTTLRLYFKHLTSDTHTNWIFVLPSLLLLALFGIPLLALILQATQTSFFEHALAKEALAALKLSLTTSLLSVGITLVLGTPLAYALARWKFAGKKIVEMLVDLPVVLPPAVAGLALLIAFGRQGLVGQFFIHIGIQLPFTSAAVVVAQTFVAVPLYIRAARIGFAGIDSQLEEAAYVEGANQWQLFAEVMFPMAGRALTSGAILAWTRALGEFGATILFAGNLEGVTQTMPLAIYLGFERNMGVAIALSVVLVGVSAILLLLARSIEKE